MEPHGQSLKRLVFKTMAEVRDGSAVISERTLSRSFSGFWAELLPLLTPSFVHMFNKMFQADLVDSQGFAPGEVEKASDLSDSALVAEVTFYLAKLATQRETSVALAWADDALMSNAVRLASAMVSSYEGGGSGLAVELTDGERAEILNLAQNYDIFFRMRAEGQVPIFNPRIPGTGFIASCEADLAIGSTLYEVKTVMRKIASKDIRQIVLYLALQAATGERRWTTAGFFNPRKALVHEFDVDDLIGRMSGGRSAMEVFQDVAFFASAREIENDTAF
jgi:hypothetical protein